MNGCRLNSFVCFVNRCVPYRYTVVTREDGITSREIEVLVIRSQKGQGLMFPKVIIILYDALDLFVYLPEMLDIVFLCIVFVTFSWKVSWVYCMIGIIGEWDNN